MYNGLAYIKLSMNYYTVYDMNKEQGSNADQLYSIMYSEFNNVVRRLLDKSLSVSDIEQFRQKIISTMDVVIAFIDRLRIYEHILNRVEYRFKDSQILILHITTHI